MIVQYPGNTHQKPRSFVRREALASPKEFPQHCVLLVPPFAMGPPAPTIITEKFQCFSRGCSVTLMGVGGERGKYPFLKER